MYRDRLFPIFHLPRTGSMGRFPAIGGRQRNHTACQKGRFAVPARSGYVTGADGKMLAFSVIMQNFHGNLRSYRQVQDRIGVVLSQWQE
jgi:D-alanyl-D-alanine carboxypeptidase